MRNLTKTLAVISLLAPASAQPLGIGDLKLHSALNQRLDAEINLLLSAGENPNDVQVRLAPPEKFDEAGIPWNYFLPQIKFEKVVQANGSVIVKLTSNQTLEEPFLDFLVEVSWAEGNLYREFTVLVDPPAVYEQPVVVAVEKESEAEATQQVEEPQAEKLKASPIAEPVQPEVAEVIPASVPGSYGPTSRTDTLWSISEKVKSSGNVSTEQMVMAIFEANPKAFYKNNVNALMSGQMLDIPDNGAIVKLSKQQAAKLFRQQNVHWNEPETKASVKEVTPKEPVKKVEVKEPVKEKEAAKKVVAQDIDKTTEQPVTQLKLEAPVESEVAEQVVVTPDQEQSEDIGEKIEVGKETLDVVSTKEESTGVKQSELDAMQARLLEMERRLKEMQELLAMKDAELAALQNKRKAEQEAQAQKAVSSEAVKPAGQHVPAKTVPVEPVKPKTAPVKPKPKLKTVPVAEEPETGFFEDSYYSMIGGLGVLMLGGLGWLWWRKRKVEEETEAESMFASSSEIRLPDSEVSAAPVEDISTSYDVGTVGESSFLSEFTPSDFDAFDSEQNEVDPISEADVYLAYGRYQQAEELMRQAISDEPDREDCKLKLLEIFYANENKQAFEDYAGELAEAGMRDNPTFWTKVMEMGNEIIPDSAVLSASDAETASFDIGNGEAGLEESTEEPKVESVTPDEENFDLESFDKPTESTGDVIDSVKQDENADSDNLDIDFDLSLFEEPEVEAKQELSEASSDEASLNEDLESIDFDLSSFAEPEKGESDAIEPESSAEEDFESFDFDFSEETNKEESREEAGEPDMDLGLEVQNDDELESFDFSEMAEPEDKSEETAKDDELALGAEEESFDFNFDFDEDDDKGLEGVSDLTDMDEFETKIDLARAYIDMGDNEAALGIAKEVLEKGNDQQKQAAQALLDQLA